MKFVKRTIGHLRSAWNWGVLGLVLALAGMVLTVIATTAAGATFVVNSTADAVDANPGNGVCTDASGNCTLRAAIMEANALPGPDIITLPAGTYTLTIPGTGENAAATGDLDITADLTINGAGATTTIIDGATLDRVFHVLAGTVTISGVTIRNGSVSSTAFGLAFGGGGIFNQGSALTVTNSTVSGNSLAGGFGGGIANGLGVLIVTNSTVSGNSAGTTNFGQGGGINNQGTLIVTNSTVSGNSAFGSDGGGINNSGNGINAGNGTVTITNSTVSGNSGGGGNTGGGISETFGGGTTLKNTIVANSVSGGNCLALGGTITSLGHNLSSDATCGFAGPGDLNNIPAHLAPLALNAPGTTQTHALCTGAGAPDPSCVAASPAINAVPLASCTVSTDQRGVVRPQPAGGACDIGAYEVVTTACVPPPSNMTNWWPLDEQTGATVVANIVNSANNGTPVPGPIGPPDPSTRPAPTTPPPPTVTPPAMVGGALYFYGQGPSGFVQVPSTGTLNIGNGDFAIDAWVYPISVPQNAYQPIVDKLNVGAKTGYSLYIRSPGAAGNARLEFVWGNGTVMFSPVQSISSIAYNQWHHVAVTFKRLVPVNPGDPSFEIKMYVNGASAGAQSGAPSGGVGTIANTLDLLIGGTRANTGTGQSFPLGEIALDEVELFDRALAQSEIQAIYNAGSAGKCKGMPVPTGPTPIVGGGAACFPLQQPLSSLPVVSNNPLVARPLGEAISGSTYYLLLEFGAFAGPVDIYIAAQLPPPATGPLFMLTSPNVLVPYPPAVPFAGLAPTLGPVALNTTSNNLLSVTPLSSIPPGTYTGHVVVVPAGTNPALFPAIPYYHWCFFRTFP